MPSKMFVGSKVPMWVFSAFKVTYFKTFVRSFMVSRPCSLDLITASSVRFFWSGHINFWSKTSVRVVPRCYSLMLKPFLIATNKICKIVFSLGVRYLKECSNLSTRKRSTIRFLITAIKTKTTNIFPWWIYSTQHDFILIQKLKS